MTYRINQLSELKWLSDPTETLLDRSTNGFFQFSFSSLAQHLSSFKYTNDFILIQLTIAI